MRPDRNRAASRGTNRITMGEEKTCSVPMTPHVLFLSMRRSRPVTSHDSCRVPRHETLHRRWRLFGREVASLDEKNNPPTHRVRACRGESLYTKSLLTEILTPPLYPPPGRFGSASCRRFGFRRTSF